MHATLAMEHDIFYCRTTIIDAISCLQASEGEIILVAGVYELLSKIQDILDRVVSKWVGNSTCILACLLNFVSLVMKSGIYSSLYFTVLMIVFLLVRLVFMKTSSGFGCKLSDHFFLSCHSLNLYEGW